MGHFGRNGLFADDILHMTAVFVFACDVLAAPLFILSVLQWPEKEEWEQLSKNWPSWNGRVYDRHIGGSALFFKVLILSSVIISNRRGARLL